MICENYLIKAVLKSTVACSHTRPMKSGITLTVGDRPSGDCAVSSTLGLQHRIDRGDTGSGGRKDWRALS